MKHLNLDEMKERRVGMKRNCIRLIAVCAGILLTAATCAAPRTTVVIEPEKREAEIKIKADNFKFEPGIVEAFRGNVIIFHVENISNSEHNFTIKDPQDNILQSVDLHPKKIVTIRIDLVDTGTYEFYCDKPFHSAFGMKGRISVDKGR